MRLKCRSTGSQLGAHRAQDRQISTLLPSVDKARAVLAREGSSKSRLTEWAAWAKGCPSKLISLRGKPHVAREGWYVCRIALVDVCQVLMSDLIVMSK